MPTYYHVAAETYEAGDDLKCFDLLEEQGYEVAWKWEDAEVGFDSDVICLFESREDAAQFVVDFQPTGRLLRVELPDDYQAWGIRLTTVREGYPAVFRSIPAAFVSEVAA